MAHYEDERNFARNVPIPDSGDWSTPTRHEFSQTPARQPTSPPRAITGSKGAAPRGKARPAKERNARYWFWVVPMFAIIFGSGIPWMTWSIHGSANPDTAQWVVAGALLVAWIAQAVYSWFDTRMLVISWVIAIVLVTGDVWYYTSH